MGPDGDGFRTFDLAVSYEFARHGQATVYFLSNDELHATSTAWAPGISPAEFANELRTAVETAWLVTPPQPTDWSAAREAFRELAKEGVIPSPASATRDALTLVFVHADSESLWIVPAEPASDTAPSDWERADRAFEAAQRMEEAWSR